jgi:hypothetical protein
LPAHRVDPLGFELLDVLIATWAYVVVPSAAAIYAVVGFAKLFLEKQKLELELRRAKQTEAARIYEPTSEEIQRYSRTTTRLQQLRSDRNRLGVSLVALVAVNATLPTLISQSSVGGRAPSPQASASSDEGAREQALINGPAEGATVPLKTVVTGTLRNALPAPVSYWLLLQDDGGDYYPVRRIAVQQNGAWEEPITFAPAWKGRTARILLVQATSEDPLLSATADSGDALHTLPVGLRTITTRHLRVQTP